MAKDTFYFSHDYNARMDNKIKELMYKLGVEGYGIYWALIEDLYNNANAMRLHYDRIATELRTHCDKIKSVIHDFNLFEIDGENFSSKSVQKRLDERNFKSINASISANIRWGNANALQTQYDRNAIKERKGKENKGKEINKEKNKKESFAEIFSNEKIVGTKENISKLIPSEHPKKGESAIRFSEDRKFAIFEDGFIQEIGDMQTEYKQPNLIKRGHIY